MPQGSIKPSVAWYVPNRKRPIAYCHPASSHLIEVLYEDGYTTPHTILPQINYDDDAKAVMQAYIDKGYGDYDLMLKR